MKNYRQGPLVTRVSSIEQARTQHGSLDSQKNRGLRFIEQKNLYSKIPYKITKTIQEEQSAFGEKNSSRVEFQELLKDLESGIIDFVIFESISRLTRDLSTATRIYKSAQKNGIEIWEVESGFNYMDPSNPFAYQMFIQKALQGEMESLQTSNRVATKHREARVRAGKDTSTIPILGLDPHPKLIGMYVPNYEELEKVTNMMKAFVEFETFAETLEYSNAMGYTTKTRWTKTKTDRHGEIIEPRQIGGKPFDVDTLKAHLTNPKYRGINYFKDTKNQFETLQDENKMVEWKYPHGRLIDEELLMKVDETLKVAGFKKRPRKTMRNEFPLLRGLLQSSEGTFYQCHSAKEGKHFYYVDAVKKHRIAMDQLDYDVLELLKSYSDEGSHLNQLIVDFLVQLKERSKTLSNTITALESECCLIKKQRQSFSDQVRELSFKGQVGAQLKFLSEEAAKLDAEIQNKEDMLRVYKSRQVVWEKDYDADKLKAAFLADVNKIGGLKGIHKKLKIRSLINQIIVQPENKIQIVINFLPLDSKSLRGSKEFVGRGEWWDQQDLNLQPPGYEPGALTN